MKSGKRILSIALVVITLISIVSISAEAVSVKVSSKNYGYMVPVNSKGSDVVSKVKLYGSYDYLNFFIHSSSKTETYFFYEVFSDKKMTKGVESGYTVCEKGDYNWSPQIKLKGKYKTKTYYVVTYAAKVSGDGKKITVDKNSMCQFELAVDRTTSFSKQMVMLKETKNTTKGAYIKWNALSGVNKYYIYRRSVTGSKWTKVGSVSKSKTSFTDTSVKNKNGNYIYSVKAVNKKGTASRYHYQGLTCLFARTPAMESVSVIYNNYIELEWEKTSSKAKYNIMRKEGNGSWKTLETNYSKTSYTDKTAKSGKTYTYSVKAVISTDYGKATSSYFANDNKAITFFGAPKLSNVALTETGVKVTWKSVEGVSGYTVMRRPLNKSEGWTILGTVDSATLEFTDATADLESAYIYTVRSEGEKGKGSYYSAGKEFIVLDEPTNVSHWYNNSSDGAIINWEVVDFATQYNVYIANEAGEWELYETVKHDSEGDSGYKIGSRIVTERTGSIKYAITALRDNTNETPINNVYEVQYYPWIITNSYISVNGMVVRWKAKNAQYYNIYRRVGDTNSEFVLIDSVEGKEKGTLMEYVDASIEDYTSYTYLVKGVYDGIEQTVCYDDSSTYSRLPETDITREEKATFLVSQYSTFLEVAVADVDTPVDIYGYNYKKDKWEKLYYGNDTYGNSYRVMRYNLAKPNEDGEYTISVVYNKDGNRTAFDANIITGKFRDAKHGEGATGKTTSKGVALTFEAVKGAKEYVITYMDDDTGVTKKTVVPENGKKTYTAQLQFDIFEDRRFDFYYDIDAVLSDLNVSRRSGSIVVEKTPDIYKVNRNDDGTVTLYWDDFEPGVSDYTVYRQVEGSTKWRTYRNIYPTKKKINGKRYLYWKDTKAEAGVKYTYKVVIDTPYASSTDYDVHLDSHYELITVEK